MLKIFKGNRFLEIRDKVILCMFIYIGVRCIELLNLKIVDVKDNYIKIKNFKNRKDRMVLFSLYIKKVIIKYLRCRESFFINKDLKEDYLFLFYRVNELMVEVIERIVKIVGVSE